MRITRITALAMLVGVFSAPSQATIIGYDLQNLAGSTWEYAYTITNELSVDIEEFTVYFDYSLTENLAVTGSPLGWDSLVIQPDTLLPDDGFFDSCSSSVFCFGAGVGIAPGDSLGGFSASFDFLGAGTPGSQFFEIVDPMTFDVLADGFTTLRDGGSVPLSEPGSIPLLLLGLFSSLLIVRRVSQDRLD